MRIKFKLLLILLAVSFLQACSGFHLRESASLSQSFQKLQLLGLSQESDLANALDVAIEEAGGQLLASAPIQLEITNIREGKHVVAYTHERKAREYLLFLKFEYAVLHTSKNTTQTLLKKQRINLDKTFLYDANFALGKAQEEKQIKDALYAEAARLVLLRLKPI